MISRGFVEDLIGYLLRTFVIFKYAGITAEDLPLLEAQPLHLIRRDVSPEDEAKSD